MSKKAVIMIIVGVRKRRIVEYEFVWLLDCLGLFDHKKKKHFYLLGRIMSLEDVDAEIDDNDLFWSSRSSYLEIYLPFDFHFLSLTAFSTPEI